MSAAGRVAVLKGGPSLERHVSLRSGAHAQEALERLGHEVLGLDVGPDLVPVLRAERPDVAFIALHGRDGEEGTLQALLEAIGVPYTGSGPAACARCTDKALAKHLMREAGIPTPHFHFLREESIKQLGAAAAVEDIEDRLGLPLVVKPARQGSALGVKFARARDELPAAMVGAFSYDDRIVIERYVKGRDLAVSVLDSAGGEASTDGGPGERSSAGGPGERSSAGGREEARDPVALPVVEAVPREEEFYDYESRYEIGMTTFVCPAELGDRTTARAQRLAVDVYKLLGCHGVARVDLMLAEEDDELWVLETNVVPGMTETSLLPQAADAAGIGFDELMARVLASAATRTATVPVRL
jgi:D-alanine-D-alanine ligase